MQALPLMTSGWWVMRPSCSIGITPLWPMILFFEFFPNLWGIQWGKFTPQQKKGLRFYSKSLIFFGVPKGIRTPVDGVKADCRTLAVIEFLGLRA
jgi:hypothetical protein